MLPALVPVVLLVGFAQPAFGSHSTVVAVQGLAYGYQVEVSLFGGPVNTRGYGQVPCTSPNTPTGCANLPASSSTPSVELPTSGGSASLTDPDGATGSVGPAIIFSAGETTVSAQGTTGLNGSVTSSTTAKSIGKSLNEQLTATNLASSCSASASGRSGSTTVTGGKLEVDSGDDIDGDGLYTGPGEHAPVTVDLPVNPVAGTTYSGHIHVNGSVDSWQYTFNEQVAGPDGSITVYAAHQRLLGPTAVGDLRVGRVDCGVTTTLVSHTAPNAVNDAYSTNEDTVLTVPAPGVLGNDTDADGDALSAVVATGPTKGTLALNADGSFTYTPAANFNGSDSFTYTVTDAGGGSATATVTITVAAVNDNPNAVDDAYTANGGSTLSVPAPGVLGNDTDPDGDTLIPTVLTGPANGTLVLNTNGSFSYSPNAGYAGTDTFTYTASDGRGGSDTATVTITVNAQALADLEVTIVDTPDPVLPSGTVTYTVTVKNNGPATATGVKLSNTTLTAGTLGTVTPAAPTCTVSKGKVKVISCTLGDLASGASAMVRVVAQAPRKTGAMSLQASASSAVTDPNTTNNTDIKQSTTIAR